MKVKYVFANNLVFFKNSKIRSRWPQQRRRRSSISFKLSRETQNSAAAEESNKITVKVLVGSQSVLASLRNEIHADQTVMW